MIYDYIIVGAGVGGLAAGLNLAKHNKKVLILEKNSLPGGLTTTFKRGRFEFDTSIYDLYDYGDQEHVGSLQTLLQEFGISLYTEVVPFNIRVKAIENHLNYEIKGSVEEWLLELEKLNPNSIEPLREYLPIIKEIHDALELLKKKESVREEEYPHFYKYLDMNAYNGLIDLKIPKETIHLFGYLWIDLGSPLNKLSFIDFTEFMYKLIFKKEVVLKEKNLSFILKLINKYENLGGKIYYRSLVTNIDDTNEIKKVNIASGKEFMAKHILCDIANHYVYKNLVKTNYPKINQLENARTLSCSSLVVYLGLNKSHEELNLEHYKYYQFENINSEKNIRSMNTLSHHTIEAIIPNVVNEFASPKNTTILILKTNYYGNIFEHTNKDYYELKEELGNQLIEEFENAFGIDIKEYIEEIEIATPLTFLRYTNNPNGSIYGYMRLGYDNSIHRLLSYDEEKTPGISIVGGSSLFGAGVDNAFQSGIYITNCLLKENEV